jgi:hypothetical protein
MADGQSQRAQWQHGLVCGRVYDSQGGIARQQGFACELGSKLYRFKPGLTHGGWYDRVLSQFSDETLEFLWRDRDVSLVSHRPLIQLALGRVHPPKAQVRSVGRMLLARWRGK